MSEQTRVEQIIRNWWNDSMRKGWRDDLADPARRDKHLGELRDMLIPQDEEPEKYPREWEILEIGSQDMPWPDIRRLRTSWGWLIEIAVYEDDPIKGRIKRSFYTVFPVNDPGHHWILEDEK